MHIKTGSWEAATTVCESDPLCDPAVLVSAANSEPQIRNRRLSPGSGSGGGGGGGGCIPENNQQQAPRQISPEIYVPPNGQPQGPAVRKEKERKAHKGRSARRESHKGAKERKVSQKERWVKESLSLLKPPPAFPVQDSPAKLQPAVSYASKVKAGAATGGLEEDRPAIGVLLQNQWGLSFISEARPVPETSESQPPKEMCAEGLCAEDPEGPRAEGPRAEGPRAEGPRAEGPRAEGPRAEGPRAEGPRAEGPRAEGPRAEGPRAEGPRAEGPRAEGPRAEGPRAEGPRAEEPSPVATPLATNIRPRQEDEENSKLLLCCRHLVEALNYHSREWNAICSREKKDPQKIVWYNPIQDKPDVHPTRCT
ncbi:ribosome-binding protein 1 [Periophthalmus magnuspinnatus]|uniref:ribosome-binding protein 1 n=1 Tax=Periophthalmus magnuspinnatus TaxID=409849 RepID=UPI00145BD078|nr:ribosome-binding protein 1 [Periophthalmus magnuspinnatus]